MRATAEQRAAVADRAGSSLLAAAAGSGKTAVLVERFARAVVEDGVAVGAILTLTFTDKAAAELRERIRRRLVELGETEHARAVDGAWIGTIHGFCARVLRARPLAAGLDPRFAVLDEGAAGRLATAAYETALEAWVAARGAPAVDVAAAYGTELEGMIRSAHDALRSRGHSHPWLSVPPEAPPPDSAALAAAAARAAAVLAAAKGDGVRLAQARAALEAAERLVAAGGPPPLPAALDTARLGTANRLLAHDDCDGYRTAWAQYRTACADHHARPVLELLDDLLRRFAAAYAEAKAARARVDFEDLELGVRDLLAGDADLRAQWSARFALIMVDEFQDTNPLQLEILETLERPDGAPAPAVPERPDGPGLFAVGDEAQSIYGFRHADVGIFRRRRDALGAERVRRLTLNFRSRPEILDVVNATFGPLLGPGFTPLQPGREPEGELRLFALDPADEPRVELLVCPKNGWEAREAELGLAALATQPARRAEARTLAGRLRREADAGRPLGEMAVLVRATASLRLFEQALEEQGLATYVVGGRGYWSQEQVRDGLAYLSVLASPHDEAALYAVLASPFCGAGTDALVLLAEAGRRAGDGPWAALCAGGEWLDALPAEQAGRLRAFAAFAAGERDRAERLPADELLERAIVATGYDLSVLARAGGERRLANLRKLMRLAREHERADGRDLRAFVAYAARQDLVEAREGEAALESDGLDAIRLMTIHRAKGLEFGVVCVADLGRAGASGRGRLLLASDGRVGLRLVTPGGGEPEPALGYDAIAAELAAAEAEEERRLLYVAATRARERLIVSGGLDLERPRPPRPGGPPLDWLAPALLGGRTDVLDPAGPVVLAVPVGATAVAFRRVDPETLGAQDLAPAPRARAAAPGTALPAVAPLVAPASRPHPAQLRLSYSSLREYARCSYRYYLERVVGMPRGERELQPPAADGLEARLRGTLAHALLERLDFGRPRPPAEVEVRAVAAQHGATLASGQVAELRDTVAAFAGSPLCERLAAARGVRREAPFAFALEPGGGGPMLSGVLDVVAREPDGTVLVVDYKTDRLGDASPAELVEREYGLQRRVYALAALAQPGTEAVEIAYCLLERPCEPVRARFTRADVPAVSAALGDLAAGVLAGEWPVAATPHRGLCTECPGRAALCSWPAAMTGREPPPEVQPAPAPRRAAASACG